MFKRSVGFSLIEVLIALLLLSVGIMGLLSIQMNNLRSSQQLQWYESASLAAEDMAGQLQAHQNLLRRLGLATSIDCTIAVLLCQDIQTWQAQLQVRWPNAEGEVQQINDQWSVRIRYRLGAQWVQVVRTVTL